MTSRTSRPSQSPASNAASHISAIGTRGRPITSCGPLMKPRSSSTHQLAPFANCRTRVHCQRTAWDAAFAFRSGYRGIPRRESQRLLGEFRSGHIGA